jgi:hypothetical protein
VIANSSAQINAITTLRRASEISAKAHNRARKKAFRPSTLLNGGIPDLSVSDLKLLARTSNATPWNIDLGLDAPHSSSRI